MSCRSQTQNASPNTKPWLHLFQDAMNWERKIQNCFGILNSGSPWSLYSESYYQLTRIYKWRCINYVGLTDFIQWTLLYLECQVVKAHIVLCVFSTCHLLICVFTVADLRGGGTPGMSHPLLTIISLISWSLSENLQKILGLCPI